MLKAHFISAWRTLTNHKVHSYLNIIGLSAGLTSFALIALWVNDELSYDKFNDKADRIVRLISLTKTASGETEAAVSSAPMAAALKRDYPEVEKTVRFDPHEEIITHNGEQILQPGILVTDPSFFEVFSYHMIEGSEATVLNEPYSIVLTQSTAKKYFGDSDPIGQTLLINMFDSSGRGAIYTVKGVIADPPRNAHFTFNMLASFKTVEVANPDVMTVDGWGDASFYTYLLLKDQVDYRNFSKKITHFYKNYIGELYTVWSSIYSYKLQPLLDIHLHSNLQYEIEPTGNIAQVYVFSTIGIFILLLAGINYVNLSIARSVGRAKEVSLKKIFGAKRGQLVMQYVVEALLTAGIAFAVSILFSSLLQNVFLQLTGKEISLMQSPLLICFLVGVTIILGIVSSMYPALAISAFKPAKALKGEFNTGSSGVFLRKLLVGAQFTITLILVTGIVVITSQMSFINHKSLGFDKDALLFLRVHGNQDVVQGFDAFKNDLVTSTMIRGVATSNSTLAGGLGTGGSETIDDDNNPLQLNVARLRVDADFLHVHGIQLMAGRNFSQTAASDSIVPVILNEEVIKKVGWKDAATAINKPFTIGGRPGVVIGVVKSFHFNSLQQAIEPLAIYPIRGRFSRIIIRADLSKPGEVIGLIEKTWKKRYPSALFDYDFFGNQVLAQYQSEQRFSIIFLYFSILSLLIACLGLFGLISYATMQKTREIGIRKVLGASVNGITAMLSKSFLKLVLISSLIATPVAWYFMNHWLEKFAYRTAISWWMFATAIAFVLLIALITVGSRAIKAALANPVKSLRDE